MALVSEIAKKLAASVWLFPAILTVVLISLTAARISGSSIGTYHQYFNGSQPDSDLIFGQPRTIRSDEWLVNSQAIIAQFKEGMPRINDNIGGGQDMSVVVDAPYRDWSVVFKPHTLGFFFLPLENAFALRWWLIGYLLMLSAYFFVLMVLPGQRLIAAGLAISLFFSGFVQWWYAYGTFGSLYFSLFIAITTVGIFRAKSQKRRMLLGVLLTYLGVCFALVLYPPFQIPCAIVTVAFLAGYLLNERRKAGSMPILPGLTVVLVSVVVAVAIVGAFIATRKDVIDTITNTDYPGTRVIKSGGISATHLFSSHLGYQFTDNANADKYFIDGMIPTNQSEASNFLLLLPFLIIPVGLLVIRGWRSRGIDWQALALVAVALVFILEIFSPGFTEISKMFFLHKVGGARVLIGMGLLNLVLVTLMIRQMQRQGVVLVGAAAFGYAFSVFLFTFAVTMTVERYPGDFISPVSGFMLSVPYAVIMYLLLRGFTNWAITAYALFAVISTAGVNPLYRGVSVLTESPVVQEIERIAEKDNKPWATDGGYMVNIVNVSGAKTLSAVYGYPQKKLWEGIDGVNHRDYNRYAHVGFHFSTDPSHQTSIKLNSPDSFVVSTYVCGDYLKQQAVGYILSQSDLVAPCLEPMSRTYTATSAVNIYRLR